MTRDLSILNAILRETPTAEHDAVCAAWEGLLPERREFLSRWPAAFIAGWLRGLVSEWNDGAPLNVLPEGGYARKVAIAAADGTRAWVWCRVPTRAATQGELIRCDDRALFAHDGRLSFRVTDDGFAIAD